MDIFISAGEVSGDHHAAGLVRELKSILPDVRFWGIGGDEMKREGVELIRNMKDLGIVGIDGVIQKLPEFWNLTASILRKATNTDTKFAIFVDYPGYNIYLAKHMKNLGIKNFYFIAPQVWGWWSFRAKLIKRYFNRVFVIYPFEVEFFKRFSIKAEYVGNPVFDTVLDNMEECKLHIPENKKVVGLLPGSRPGEVKRILPKIMKIKEILNKRHGDIHFILSIVPQGMSIHVEGDLTVVKGRGREVMSCSDALLIASGTATLEAALYEKPFVVLYELSALSYIIGSMVKRVEFLSLANIVAGKEIVKEFIQHIPYEKVARIIEEYLYNENERSKIKAELSNLKRVLKGSAYKNTARLIKREVFDEND